MDYTPIIQAFIALLATVCTCVVIPWIRKKTTAEQLEQLEKWSAIAVAAAEQMYESSNGTAKKEYCIKFLYSMGFTFDVDTVEAAIESAVIQLHTELYK